MDRRVPTISWLALAGLAAFALLPASAAVRFSPDGKLLAFAKPAAIPSVSAGGETLFTIPVDGGHAKVMSHPGDYRTQTTGLAWRPLPPRG